MVTQNGGKGCNYIHDTAFLASDSLHFAHSLALSNRRGTSGEISISLGTHTHCADAVSGSMLLRLFTEWTLKKGRVVVSLNGIDIGLT